MRAAMLVEPGVIRRQDIPIPDPQFGEVLVKVAYCGICGSDIPRVFQGMSKRYPNILGHEFSGVIEAVGDGVDDSLIGSPVAGIPLIPCGTCKQCSKGDYSLCERYDFIGSRRFGAFAEYVAIPVENVFPLPEGVTLKEAAFFEPATVALHAIDLASFVAGSSAVVVGCGTIGVLLVQALKARGAAHVAALGRRSSRLDAARWAGADSLHDTTSVGWKDTLFSECSECGYDYVFDTSGNFKAMVDSLGLSKPKGRVCYVGTPKEPMVFSVSQWEEINRKELTVTGSWMSYSAPFPGREWHEVSQLFVCGAMGISEALVDMEYTLDDCALAFDRFSGTGTVSGKIIVRCWED